jgi:hypothetical protein
MQKYKSTKFRKLAQLQNSAGRQAAANAQTYPNWVFSSCDSPDYDNQGGLTVNSSHKIKLPTHTTSSF